MRTLDRNAPYTTTFGPDTATIPFFQNGLYYKQDGTLAENKHNKDRLTALGFDPELLLNPPAAAPAGEPALNVPIKDEQPNSGEPDPLNGANDVQVFGYAQRLRAQLDVSEDGDNYVPTLDNAQGNRDFVIRHLKGDTQE